MTLLVVVWFSLLILPLMCTAQLSINHQVYISIEENLSDIQLFNGTFTAQGVNCICKTVQCQSDDPFIMIRTDLANSPGKCTFNVTLLTPVDYEKTTSFTVTVVAGQDCSGIQSSESGKKNIFIKNVMDTPPVFSSSIYSVSIKENHEANKKILSNMRATDEDELDFVNYSVHFPDQEDKFFQVQSQINPEFLDVYLISALDFEKQHVHHFTITANDSVGMNNTCDVFIKVINIQDTPPSFTALQYNGRVNEAAAVGSVVLKVQATDGDIVLTQDQWEGTKVNQIYYSILQGDAGMFGINSSTGELITVAELDIDNNKNVMNGLVRLTILAEELNTSMEPQYGDSNATVLVLIQIEDANDNRPQFNSQSFTGSIRADAQMTEFITIDNGGYISVYDIDQAPNNNHFTLHIEKDGQPWDVFKPNIEAQYAYATVMIQLNKDNGILDLAETHVKFEIVAQENGSSSNQKFAPTKSQISLWVKAPVVPVTVAPPIISLPLSTSDIIVFVVGFLLLLNVGLTIFVCFILSGGRGYSKKIWNRNSKYYVSNRNKTNPENGNIDISYANAHKTELSKSKLETNESSKIDTDKQSATEHTQNIHIQTQKIKRAAAKQNSTDHTEEKETQRKLSADTRACQVKSQEALMTILKEDDPSINDRKHPKSTVSQENSKPQTVLTQQDNYIKTQPNLKQGLSSFMQKVHHKIGTGNKQEMFNKNDSLDYQHVQEISTRFDSSPPETPRMSIDHNITLKKMPDDGIPLIKSSHVNLQSNKSDLLTKKSLTHPSTELIIKKDKANESNKLDSNKPKVTLNSDKDYKTIDSETLKNEKNKMDKLSVLKSQDEIHVKTPQACNASFYPTTTQITQTGVPPVALALACGTDNLLTKKIPDLGIINPVFETSSSADKPVLNSFLVSAAPGPTSPIQHAHQSAQEQPAALDTLLSSVSSHAEQLKSQPDVSNPQTLVTSESQDFILAAKNFLASVKKDSNPTN